MNLLIACNDYYVIFPIQSW